MRVLISQIVLALLATIYSFGFIYFMPTWKTTDWQVFVNPGNLILLLFCTLSLGALLSHRVKQTLIKSLLAACCVVGTVAALNSALQWLSDPAPYSVRIWTNLLGILLGIAISSELLMRAIYSHQEIVPSLSQSALASLCFFTTLQKLQLGSNFNPFQGKNFVQWVFIIVWICAILFNLNRKTISTGRGRPKPIRKLKS